MSAEARVQSGSLRWAQPRRYLSQPRQQGRVSAEARVQAGSLRWAQPRRWPLYPWAGSRMTEIPGDAAGSRQIQIWVRKRPKQRATHCDAPTIRSHKSQPRTGHTIRSNYTFCVNWNSLGGGVGARPPQIAQLLDVGIRRGHLRVARAMPTLPARAARARTEVRGPPAARSTYL